MKLSINSWMYGAFPSWLPLRSLEDTIAVVAAIGYEGIELGAAAPHAFPAYLDAQRRAAIVSCLERHGLEVSALCPAYGGGPGYNPISPDQAERDAGLAYMTACIELAADIGCSKMIWLGGYRRYGQTYADAWSNALRSLSSCAEIAARHQVALVVEPTSADSNFLDQASDCARLIDEAGVNAGILLDTYHILHRSDEIADALRSAGERLAYVHLSDLNRDAPGTHSDFGSVVAELRSLGYEGWLTMEIAFNRREVDPDGVARSALRHMRETLAAHAETEDRIHAGLT